MYFYYKVFFILFSLFSVYTGQSQQLSVVSWNLKDFGQSRDNQDIKLIAQVLRDADIVAIQEVVAKHPGGAKAVARLSDQLNRMGSKWDYIVSDPTKSPSVHISERYAFLWKTSKVSISGGRPQLVSELEHNIHREPYLAQFKSRQGELLTILNYHACTHKKHNPERAEIKAISNWLLKQSFDNIIWAGDMNLVISDQAFRDILSSGFRSVLNGEKTSLKMKCKNGDYLSKAVDNVLYRFENIKYGGGRVMDFVEEEDCRYVSWKRASYSDHLGVELKMGI